MILFLAGFAFVLALIPFILFVLNFPGYRVLPAHGGKFSPCSVLIPARNEESNIGEALASILQNTRLEMEVIVLDDSSTDGTAAIVRAIPDPRVRLETARPLPAGWCGKNFACQQLAELARHPVLVFMDADVRVSRPDSLARLIRLLEDGGSSLISGVPRQITGSLMEKMIVPLIHFVLLGFLPFSRMRHTRDPRFSAACGQILAMRREDYHAAGGHAAVADRIHDAVALTRRLRAHGFRTDLFDATETFSCRMYHDATEVWNGFAKNAHEGLGSARLIFPATMLLLGGQVLPFTLLPLASTPLIRNLLASTLLFIFLPRIISAVRFRQSYLGVLLHPMAIIVLLGIQWSAFLRTLRRVPATWKGRAYVSTS